jgi:hypothetical protein
MTSRLETFPKILKEDEWVSQRSSNLAPIQGFLAEHLKRREDGIPHPVFDFLFDYYSFRPALLNRWSPGVGVALQGARASDLLQPDAAESPFVLKSGCVTLCSARFPAKRHEGLFWIRDLLQNVQSRPPMLHCHGLHEWAMVYRLEKVRHGGVPLRLSPSQLASFLESQTIFCSHYDAFRFFAASARPMNQLQPAKGLQHTLEQPGCIHVNMDLYRWAYKFYPWIPTNLIVECFLLAIRARTIDMRASPYDLEAHGFPSIPIETPAGRDEYRRLQSELMEAAIPLRSKLLEAYNRVIDWLVEDRLIAGC